MSRNSDSMPNRDFGRINQNDFFGAHQYENGAKRIERGISMGMGSQALHEELNLIRQAAMQNGTFNLAQYKADVKAIDRQLHKDGFLPNLHLDVDSQGRDIIKRGGDRVADSDGGGESTGRRHGRRKHTNRGHRRGGDGGGHRRAHRRAAAPPADGSNEGGDEQISSLDSVNEQELRPTERGDRTARRSNQGAFEVDPNKDRGKHAGEPSIWGPPTITAAQIDKVLRDAKSPAAGLGAYIYDRAQEKGINPAFALAMYGQESTYGTKGAAVRNNSFGNIREGRHGFKRYDSVKDGVDHFMELMTKPGYYGKSLNAVINRYAPGSDGNNPNSYQRFVANHMRKWSRMPDDTSGDNQRYV